MENLDIIIGTCVVTGAFATLGYGTFMQFGKMHKDTYDGGERGRDATVFKAFMVKLFG